MTGETHTGRVVASCSGFKGGWRLAILTPGQRVVAFYTRPRAPIARDAARVSHGQLVTLTGSQEGNRRALALDGISLD